MRLEGLAAPGSTCVSGTVRDHRFEAFPYRTGAGSCWLVGHRAALDHTAKYGLSALMLAVIGGRTDVVRILTAAGADLCLRGTGAPGFTAKTTLDLAIARGDADMVEILRTGASCRPK